MDVKTRQQTLEWLKQAQKRQQEWQQDVISRWAGNQSQMQCTLI